VAVGNMVIGLVNCISMLAVNRRTQLGIHTKENWGTDFNGIRANILANSFIHTAKNDQVVAILMKTGWNNVVRPTLLTVVNRY
jgi:glucose-6-phosphate dehydrogenase assembly protein OpcA